MNILRFLPAMFLVAGCASPMAGDFLSTSTMGVAIVGAHTSDDENEEGIHDGGRSRSVDVRDDDNNEEGRFDNHERAHATSDTDENEEGAHGI